MGQAKNTRHYLSPSSIVSFDNSIEDILCDVQFVKKSKKHRISNVSSVFDIEATSFYQGEDKRACMYAWVFGINGRCIRGRTWQDFLDVIDRVIEYYEISLEKRFVVYVHNLSYEFQWFKDYFEWDNVFSLDNRKPIYAITKQGIEFRCSYLLSGYSLAKLGENLTKYKVNKAVGDLDYRLIRHSTTPLTDKEWGYILNDGLVVMAHIQEEIERLGTLADIPLTKTGYVRELCRERCLRGDSKFEYTKRMQNLTLTLKDYKQLKATYTGGFTHANSHYVGTEVANVHSFDFTSSYPAVMVSEKFPMSKAISVDIKDEDDFKRKLNAYCCMFVCRFHNIISKCSCENYISRSRCIDCEHYVLNNGRVVEAEILTMSMTEQDFFIIYQMYDWDSMDISNFKIYYADYLPKDFILTILELYKDKTSLKGVEGKEIEYMVSKGMINASYGMCVTDPCKDENIYQDHIWQVTKANTADLLKEYNKNRNRFLYYPWGVWITAYARANLFSGILEFGDDYIYSDTDSIKVINIDKHKDYITNYNKQVNNKIEKCLKHYGIDRNLAFPKTIKGVVKPLGVWEYEGVYSRFKTLGAKRYMTEQDGDISITIAGVSKSAGKQYLRHKYKTNDKIFKAFTEDLYFPAEYNYNGEVANGSGKLCHTYIDEYTEGEVIDYMGNVGIYNEQSSVHMENTDYTLSLDVEFKNLLLGQRGGHLTL